MSAVVQDQPRLQAGRHQHPDDGVCLMEYVSRLAGDTFTDAPRCTDPLLAELARMVNDSIGEQARASLITLAPGLAALPRTAPSAAPALVAAVLGSVLRCRPGRKDLLRHHRRAARRASASPGRPLGHVSDVLYRYGPARHALSCAVYVASEHAGSDDDRDAVLAGMLAEAVDVADGLIRT